MGHREEGDKEQKFGFSGFGHTNCEISTLFACEKKTKNLACVNLVFKGEV